MKYKIEKRKSPNNPDGPEIQFAMPVNAGKMSVKELSEEIAARTSLSRGDIESTLTSLTEVVPFYLKHGMSVSLGNLGILRLSINSEGVPEGEVFKHTNIKGTRTVFTASVELKEALKHTTFEEDKTGNKTDDLQEPDITNPPAPFE